MIPKNQRLSRNSIQYLLKKGKKLVSKAFTLKFLPTTGLKSRFCVVISAKTAPLAVTRNLIRRRIYEALRLQNHLLAKPHDIIIITNKKILDLSYNEIEQTLKEIFNSSKT